MFQVCKGTRVCSYKYAKTIEEGCGDVRFEAVVLKTRSPLF